MPLFNRSIWFAAIFLSGLFAFADNESVLNLEIHSVQVGVEGFYKNGLWTPVSVTCALPNTKNSDDAGALAAQSLFIFRSTDSDGTPIEYRSKPLGNEISVRRRLSDGSADDAFFFTTVHYVKLGRKDGPLTVELEIEGIASAKKQLRPYGNPIREQKTPKTWEQDCFYEPIASERPIYLVVGNDDIGLQGAIAELSLREERRPILVKVNRFKDLPRQWFGFESVDTVVLTTTEPEQFVDISPIDSPISSIDLWVKLGGRLIFCPGRNSEKFLEHENAPLRPFLPGNFAGMTELRQSTPLEVFVNSKRQIFMNGTEEAPYLKLPRFTEPRGKILLSDGDLPIALRCAHGLGMIIYFGGDLGARPLNAWRDRVQLVRNIMLWNTERQSAGQRTASMIQLGYNDISGQVRSSLDHFDGVRIIPFSIILMILAIYWLIVGPFDWFLVQKVFKRPGLTWATFPFWVVLFCVLAYLLAAPGRPNRTMLNELTLVDLDNDTKFVRCSSWANLYSPADARYGLALGSDTDKDAATMLFSWHGLPGSGLGGMAPKTVNPTVWQTGSVQRFDNLYSRSRLPTINDMPIQVRSTKSFFGQCWTEKSTLDAVTAELKDEEGVPVGTLTLPKDFPKLEQCVLVYGRWILNIETLNPGEATKISRETVRRELRDLLLPPEVLKDINLRKLSSYNAQSTDFEYIVRVLSFHNVLGGFEIVGLDNSFQRSLDMSDLISIGQAILVGTVSEGKFGPKIVETQTGAASLTAGRRNVVIRQSFPVARSAAQRIELFNDGLQQKERENMEKFDYGL